MHPDKLNIEMWIGNRMKNEKTSVYLKICRTIDLNFYVKLEEL